MFSRNVRPAGRLVIFSLAAGIGFTACTDSPTAPAPDSLPSPSRTMVCWRAGEDGTSGESRPYDPAVGCPAGFDIKIWY
jgi:hypothetical protein